MQLIGGTSRIAPLVFLSSLFVGNFVGNFVEKESIQPVMLTQHKLKVYEEMLPTRVETTPGRELMSRIIANVSGF
jgi:hypothetical protein